MSVGGAFRGQARACAALGAPFMGSLMEVLAARLEARGAVGTRLHAWPGDMSARGDSVPLRLAGGLHALVLGGQEPELAALWGRPEADPAALWGAVAEVLERRAGFLDRWLDRAPQTNEVGRSAVPIAVAHWLGRPLVVSELGASAGLNLLFDRWRMLVGGVALGPGDAPLTLAPGWQGPVPPMAAPPVVARAGVDLNPVDPVADRLRLVAYVWPDQPDRLARMAAALDTAAQVRPEVVRGDAADWLETRLQRRWPGAVHLVFHTIAFQYFLPATRARIDAALAAAGARATPDAPLARLAMEADGAGEGAGITLTLWPGGAPWPMGRVDYHGRWLRWTPPFACGG